MHTTLYQNLWRLPSTCTAKQSICSDLSRILCVSCIELSAVQRTTKLTIHHKHQFTNSFRTPRNNFLTIRKLSISATWIETLILTKSFKRSRERLLLHPACLNNFPDVVDQKILTIILKLITAKMTDSQFRCALKFPGGPQLHTFCASQMVPQETPSRFRNVVYSLTNYVSIHLQEKHC